MKKLLAVLLTVVMIIPCFSAISFVASAAASEHVYMIITNPGEDMNTQVNIGWHADEGYTESFVEYTKAEDTAFASATKVVGTYDAEAYKWFSDRATGISISSAKFDKVFLDYGVSLNGLKPDTDYIYRVGDGKGGYSDTYAFKTAGQTEFSFLWLSDMHLSNENTDAELNKYKKTQAVIDFLEPLAKYDIGLNFNTGDVVACGDRYGFWQKYYNMDVMKKYTYAATVGNHDLYDSMMEKEKQSDGSFKYVEDYTRYWKSTEYFKIVSNYPKNGYTQTSGRLKGYLESDGYNAYVTQPSNVLVDPGEGTLAGKLITGAEEDLNGRAYWFIYNRMLFIVFDYYAMTYNSEKAVAFEWANKVIEANKGKYDYLIATEHENLLWGDSGTSRYYDNYKDWLSTANVDIFFAGDNHIYFRSDSLLNGEVNTDPEKGTYVLQASAITNTSSYSNQSGPVGTTGLNHFSAPDYLGGAIIDVDSDGLHLTVATGTGLGDNLAVYETVTIPKKVRYADKEVGYYNTESEVSLLETADLTATKLTTIPKGTLIEVFETKGVWCKIRYNGFSGWARLTSEECLYTPAEFSTYETLTLKGYNQGYSTDGLWAYDLGYTKGNGTIANGGWLFTGNTVFTAIEQEDGSYIITEINADGNPKSTTPLIDNGIILMCGNGDSAKVKDTLVVGYRFTFDWANAALNQANPGEANKEIIIPDFEVGDANKDGEINNIDAALILKYDAGIVSEIDDSFADVNGDGEVNNIDAALILKYDAGIIEKF